MFTIYRFPLDYPDRYVVREWLAAPAGPIAIKKPFSVVRSLALARASIPPDCVRLPREENDDPVIVETWL